VGGGEAVTKTEDDRAKNEAYFMGLIFSAAALVAIAAGKWGWAIFCFIPVSMFFAWGWWLHGEQDRVTRRNVKLQKKKVEDRRTAALTWKRNQFATWVMKKYNVEILHDPKSPEYKRKWGEWQQEIKDSLAAEKAAKEELERRRAEAGAARQAAAMKARETRLRHEAAARRAATRKAAAKKKKIKTNKASLRKALVDIQKRGLSRKIDNVSRHSYQSLLSVTTRFEGIRKNGTLDQLNKSILSNIGSWTTQLAKIQELNAEMTKDPALEDLLRMEQHSSIDKTRVKHPELKKKATNLRGRIERRKEKLGRVRKEAAFSRPMLQTQDVPNATLLRKEKAWKLNDGCCTRCDKPSSEMAFYWDVYPDLLLVVICDDCAAKEVFVHAQDPGEDVGGDVDDLADVFMRAVGTSEKKSRKK
jgi:hypothetical protein